tara:strand:- start:1197 stop:1400 length:204 start_codon:yes stop_codon:yes gene_type:complete
MSQKKETDKILIENQRLQCLIVGTDMSDPKHQQYVTDIKQLIKENLNKLATVNNDMYKLFQRTNDKN